MSDIHTKIELVFVYDTDSLSDTEYHATDLVRLARVLLKLKNRADDIPAEMQDDEDWIQWAKEAMRDVGKHGGLTVEPLSSSVNALHKYRKTVTDGGVIVTVYGGLAYRLLLHGDWEVRL